MSNVTVIYNPASGSAPGEDEIVAAFEEHANGHSFTFSPTTEDDPGFGQTREAIDARVDAVIAVGGDGTVRAVVDTLAGSHIPLGVDAIPAALSGSTRKLDVCTVNGERFAVMAGTGFDALMIRDAPDGVKHASAAWPTSCPPPRTSAPPESASRSTSTAPAASAGPP